MKKIRNTKQAVEALMQDEYASWSIEGAKALVEYWAKGLIEHMEEIEEDTGEEIGLDIIGIRCHYSEMTLEEVLDNYMAIKEDFEEYKEENEHEDYEGQDKDIIKEIISEYTTIIEINEDKIIIQNF